MCKKLFGWAVLVVCLGLGSAAYAQQGPPPQYDQGPPPNGGTDYGAPPPVQQQRPRRPRVKRRAVNHANQFRPILSVSTIFLGNGDAMPVTQSFGVMAGLKFLQPFELEVGASFFDFSYSFFANAGASWAIGKWRGATGAGLELRAGFLAGYRFQVMDDAFGVDSFHGVTGAASLEFNIWLSRRFGIHFHFAGGMGVWVARSDNSMPFIFPEFRSAVGLIF